MSRAGGVFVVFQMVCISSKAAEGNEQSKQQDGRGRLVLRLGFVCRVGMWDRDHQGSAYVSENAPVVTQWIIWRFVSPGQLAGARFLPHHIMREAFWQCVKIAA